MPTYEELRSEVWWNNEFQPPTLAKLCADLRAFFKVSAVAIGSKGDNNHLRGYHRSFAWLKNSRYCSNRTYSTSETAGNRRPANGNHLCAMDITIPAAKLIPMCRRLDIAVRAGRLEKITEWYGNDDGDNRVDGYNNIVNAVASSDTSHLWHAHLSFDRGLVGKDHTDLYRVLTGTSPEPPPVPVPVPVPVPTPTPLPSEEDDMYVIFKDSQDNRWVSNGWERESLPVVTPDDRHFVLVNKFKATVLRDKVLNPDAYGPIRAVVIVTPPEDTVPVVTAAPEQ